MPNPEELAHQNIDRKLLACGWTIQDMFGLNRYARLGVAAWEFPLDMGKLIIFCQWMEGLSE